MMNKIFPGKTAYRLIIIFMMVVGIVFFAMLAIVNAFPAAVVIGFMVLLILMLGFTGYMLCKTNEKKQKIGIAIAIVFTLIYGLGIYYLSTTYTMFSRISTTGANGVSSVDVTKDSFNIYITGIDQWTVEKGMDLERSDVNMIASVCPKTRKITLTSIPRDAYVPLHRTGTMDKLTHTGIYGVDETLNTVHDWLNIDLNYYVKVNFSACVHIVDAIGGVDVYSPVAFDSAISNCSYQQGWNHLNGRQALYFARERKAFNAEDQLRVRNQLIVIKAMLNKIMSSKTLLLSYGKLMNAMVQDMETNMPVSDIKALVKMQMSDLSKWDIKMQRMTGTYEMAVVASMNAKNKYSVLMVDESVRQKCLQNIENTLHPTAAQIKKATKARQKNSIRNFFGGLF